MYRILLFALLSSLGLVGCGSDETDTAEEVTPTLPKSGDWTIVTTGYSNDDCNADGFLIPFDEISIADVDTSSFSITYYLENVRIGESSSSCSHVGDDIFDCSEIAHSTPFSSNATMNMTAVGSVTMISETSISGAGNLVLDCTGADCPSVAAMTTTGSLPCDTTLNWTASAE